MRLPSLTGVASVPAVQALALSGSLWLLLFVYCNFALWRDPHGAYFHSEHVYDLGYSAVRQMEARAFLQQYANPDSTSTPPGHAGQNPALCAGFVTVRRQHPDAALYFSDAVGSMLKGLSALERAALSVNVLFANAADPAVHPDFGAPWLTVVDHAAGYENVTDAELAELRALEQAQDFQRKGVLDYVYMLERCYRETRAPFIAVFEDDIVFAVDWLARTLLGLQHLATTPAHELAPWLYLRLFYSETYMGWDPEADWWYGHLFVTLGLVSITTAVLLVLLRQCLRLCGTGGGGGDAVSYHPVRTGRTWIPHGLRLRLRLDAPTIAALSLVVAPAFAVLAFMAGKYNLPIYKLRGGSSGLHGGQEGLQDVAGVVPMDQHACCSQALVFDRARVPELVAHLRELGRGQTDLMIEDYCDKKPLRRFALGEQAVQHVATVSSRGGGGVNGHSVWAFYFEESKAEELERRRWEILGMIDWNVFKALQARFTK